MPRRARASVQGSLWMLLATSGAAFAEGDPRAAAAAVTSETIVDEEGREYARTGLVEIVVPDQARVLPGRTLVAVTWTHEVPTPPGGNVFGRHLQERVVLIDADGARLLPRDAYRPMLREALLAAAPVAADASARLELGRTWMYLLQLGEEPRGKWWGDRATVDAPKDGGHALRLEWVHGKSFSWTDLFTLRFDGDGRLIAIDHEERAH